MTAHAIELDPKDAFAFSNRGFSYSGKGDYDRAIADLTRAIELDPKYTIAFSNRGFAYGGKGDYDRAIADLTQAIELDPTLAAPYGHRGVAFLKTGKLDLAYLTKALELKPDYEEARTALADLDKAEANGLAK